MKKQLKIVIDGTTYRRLKTKSKQLGYLSVQELIRTLIRERFEKSELDRLGERIERRIKKVI